MKATIIFCFMTLISMVNLYAGESLKVWDSRDARDIRFNSVNAGVATFNAVSEVKAPDDKPALEIQLGEGSQTTKAWDIQLNFLYNGSLKAGQKYEISFMCKGDKPGKIIMIPSQTQKPYAAVDNAAYRKVAVEINWQPVKLFFTPKKDWSPENLTLPRMMLANYGNLGKIYIGTVTLAEVK